MIFLVVHSACRNPVSFLSCLPHFRRHLTSFDAPWQNQRIRLAGYFGGRSWLARDWSLEHLHMVVSRCQMHMGLTRLYQLKGSNHYGWHSSQCSDHH